MKHQQVGRVFKRCAMCGEEWQTRRDFLHDADVHFVGFQRISEKASAAHKVAGLLIYNHARTGCGTTLCITAQQTWIRTLAPVEREPLEQATLGCFV